MTLFSLSDVRVQAGQKTLLAVDSLQLPANQLIALVGANGAGKSTLLATLMGGDCTGTVLCQGVPATHLLKQGKMALVGQHERFGLPLTVLEYALLGATPRLCWYQKPNASLKQKALSYLREFHLETLAQKRLSTLSGGEKQRLAIVRAIMQDTDIVLLDEPTNHLDIKHERLLFDHLRRLVNAQKSLVVVLHNLSHAHRYADTVVALKDGQILAQGTPDAVMTQQNLQLMYDTQIRRYQTDDGVVFV